MLITGNVIVAPGGRTEPDNVVLEDDRHLEDLRRWADTAQAHGARLVMQLSHAGRQAPRTVTWHSVGPSPVKLRLASALFSQPRALTEAEIAGLIERFANAAAVARDAGFSGVQIHGAHGYLVSQFLSPLSNRRDDRWGGSLEGRMRLPLAIVRRVRQVAGPSFAVGIKLNSADFQRGGFEPDEAIIVAQALEAEGVDFIEVSGGSYESPKMMGGDHEVKVRDSTRRREAYFVEYAEQMRAAVKLPLMLTGGFVTAAGMEDAIASGAVDIVGIARPMAIDPELPRKILAGEIERAPVAKPRVGVRLLDDLLQLAWFQRQLHRLGDGREPDPRLGNWSTVAQTMGHNAIAWARAGLGARRSDQLAISEARA
jgi:2,4-dienoyl-CoA reductase-like NADH-dependent reductase (Old Yellow Enzyme family)